LRGLTNGLMKPAARWSDLSMLQNERLSSICILTRLVQVLEGVLSPALGERDDCGRVLHDLCMSKLVYFLIIVSLMTAIAFAGRHQLGPDRVPRSDMPTSPSHLRMLKFASLQMPQPPMTLLLRLTRAGVSLTSTANSKYNPCSCATSQTCARRTSSARITQRMWELTRLTFAILILARSSGYRGIK